MYGIMNRLSELGHDIYLISNSENHSLFHNKIKHIHLGYQINAKRKRTIQILTGIFPVFILYYIYKNLFILINSIVDDYNLFKDRFISFEYLDNTLSYLFFKKKNNKRVY